GVDRQCRARQHQSAFCHRKAMCTKQKRHFLKHHSLSLAVGFFLIVWIVLYTQSDPRTHLGAFFGNAIADWTGLFVSVLATKFLYEVGSAESRKPPHRLLKPILGALQRHSLSLFLLITGVCWVVLFARSNPDSKWGQVV